MRTLILLTLLAIPSVSFGQIQQGYDPAGWPGITPPEAKPITESHLWDVHYMEEVLVPDMWDAIVGHEKEAEIAVVLLDCEYWLYYAEVRGDNALAHVNSCLPWEDDENYVRWIAGGIREIWRDVQGRGDSCLQNAVTKYDEAVWLMSFE